MQKIQTIQQLVTSTPIIFAGNLSLAEVALLNTKSSAFVGVDTSIMHLSAANQIPTFAFFGPTFTPVWYPWDSTHPTYTEKQGRVRHLGKHCIYQEELPCVPCGKAGCKDSGISDCLLSKIHKKDALKALQDFLSPLLTQ